MPRKELVQVRLVKAQNGRARRRTDAVAVEEPMEVRVDNKPAAVIMRTPGDDFALAAGFLYTEGLLNSADDIGVISYCRNTDDPALMNIVNVKPVRRISLARLKRNTYSASSCGICGKAALDLIRTRVDPIRSRLVVKADILYRLPETLRASQPIFGRTGGLHAAGVFDEHGQLLFLKEDIGRHNAVDKVVGEALMRGSLPLSRHILLVSGRASFEIMQKAARAGLPIVAAISAPSSLAVDFAREFGMTLAGLLRDRTMNVYAGQERIRL
jgi:FdhD protein